MFCEKCGQNNDPSARFCARCGSALAAAPIVVNDGGNVFIPKNTLALWSYYLGIASLICCAVTGIPALLMGILALQKAKEDPSLKGQAHAWVGIILGGLSLLFTLLGIVCSAAGVFK